MGNEAETYLCLQAQVGEGVPIDTKGALPRRDWGGQIKHWGGGKEE